MRTNKPRLPPMKDEEFRAEHDEALGAFRKMGVLHNVVRTMVRHPRALKAFRTWATYVMIDKNALDEREREIVGMRTAWRIKAGYVWARHIPYGKKAGLSDVEMEALKKPLSAHKWSAADAALIKASDALVDTFYIPDDVWAELTAHFNEEQCMDVVYCCGHFCLLGMILNVSGIPVDSDVTLDPDLDLRGKEYTR
jgi:alkylhydroperoxidase family enzyme